MTQRTPFLCRWVRRRPFPSLTTSSIPTGLCLLLSSSTPLMGSGTAPVLQECQPPRRPRIFPSFFRRPTRTIDTLATVISTASISSKESTQRKCRDRYGQPFDRQLRSGGAGSDPADQRPARHAAPERSVRRRATEGAS